MLRWRPKLCGRSWSNDLYFHWKNSKVVLECLMSPNVVLIFIRSNLESSCSKNCSFLENSRYHRLPELLFDALPSISTTLSYPLLPSFSSLRPCCPFRPRDHASLTIVFSSPGFLSLSSLPSCRSRRPKNRRQFHISYSPYYFATQSAT